MFGDWILREIHTCRKGIGRDFCHNLHGAPFRFCLLLFIHLISSRTINTDG